MKTPWMFVTGIAMLGWFLPEVFAVFGKARVPFGMNLLAALAFGLIAGAFV